MCLRETSVRPPAPATIGNTLSAPSGVVGMGLEEGRRKGEQISVPAPPHVLIFPFPAQGHISPMLKLAELLSLARIRATFLNTDHNQGRLLSSPSVRARLARRPGLRLRSVPDGLPEDHPRDGSRVLEMVDALEAAAAPLFRELLSSEGNADPDGDPPVTCVVGDGLIPFAVDVAEELGVPFLAFRTSSACSFWAYQRIDELIATGIIPFQQDGHDLDELVPCVPGMESFLRRRDLPSFCRTSDADDPSMRFLKGVIRNATRYRGLILNTPEFVESSALTRIRGLIPSTYPIGPLHGLLRTVEGSSGIMEGDGNGVPSSYSASLWREERACMEWLDARPPASVVYVSFGSLALLKREQLLELCHGLLNSGYHFLWVVRPGLVVDGGGASGLPAEVAEGMEERGFLVGWAPQQEVLAHPAVGCFLTHSGWNSTLESMWAAVPMVCLPYFADQLINSRFVGEVWGIGVDIKDSCDRATVEKAVREVMAGEGGWEMRQAVTAISKTIRGCVEEGGSSYMNLDRLIRDIGAMSSPRHRPGVGGHGDQHN